MNKKQELEIKMEQNKADVARLLSEQGRLQNEMAELKKPELRRGDYGYDEKDGTCILVGSTLRHMNYNAFPLTAYDCNGIACGYVSGSEVLTRSIIRIGNIFDDLERNSVDLDRFVVEDIYPQHDELKVEITNSLWTESDCVRFWVKYGKSGTHMHTKHNLDQTIEIHQKLGQVIAKMQRQLRLKG
ncbi:MAG: hypothetical protein KAS32_10510 [Candidatus Peribacteraceae bacterium]|nr:hypothetical protein [Candidatus Peribacteraceae bacterium]